MKEEKNVVNPPNDTNSPKRAYATPDLVEYGTVAKLTQGSFSGGVDPGARRRGCL